MEINLISNDSKNFSTTIKLEYFSDQDEVEIELTDDDKLKEPITIRVNSKSIINFSKKIETLREQRDF